MVVYEEVVSIWGGAEEGETEFGGCAYEDDGCVRGEGGAADELRGVQADGGGGAVDEDVQWV